MKLNDFQKAVSLLQQDVPWKDRDIVIIADGKLYEPIFIGDSMGKIFWVETKPYKGGKNGTN